MDKLETNFIKPVNNSPKKILKREKNYLGYVLKQIDKLENKENTLFKISRQTIDNGRIKQFLTNSVWVRYENGSRRLFNVNHGDPIVGSGGYKVVKKITERETKKNFAIGQFKSPPGSTKKLHLWSQKLPDSFENHKYLLPGKIDKVTKIKCIDRKLEYHNSFAIFSELYEGDLLKLQKEINSSKMLAQLFFRMTSSVLSIHTEGFCHRDIKNNNWLYRIDGDRIDLKLMDYDLAIPLHDKSQGAMPTKWAGTSSFLPKNIEGNWKEINVGRYHQKYIDYYALYQSMHIIFKHVDNRISLSEDLKKIDRKIRNSMRIIHKDSPLDDLYKLANPSKVLDDLNAFIQKSPTKKPQLKKVAQTRLAPTKPKVRIGKAIRYKKDKPIVTRRKASLNQGIGKRHKCDNLNSANCMSRKPIKKIARERSKKANEVLSMPSLKINKRAIFELIDPSNLPKRNTKKVKKKGPSNFTNLKRILKKMKK